jgi:hypothetical protein
MVMELGQLKEQNEILRGVLKEQQQEIDCLKVCFQDGRYICSFLATSHV